MSALEDHGGSTIAEVEEEDRLDAADEKKSVEIQSKTAEDKERRNGEIDGVSNVVAEEVDARGAEEKAWKQQEAPPKLGYFCEPNQNLKLDAFKMFFFHMLPFTPIPHLLVAAILYWSYTRHGVKAFTFFLTLIAVLAMAPIYYSPTYQRFVREPLYRLFARYVPKAQYGVPEKPFPKNKSYIFAAHPHGRMFFSNVIFTQLHEDWRKGILEQGSILMAIAGNFFYIPILNLIFSLAGGVLATRSSIVSTLRKGNHICILIGGIKEVLMGTEEHFDRIYLNKRKGFIKIALEEGAGVVPVYYFNENQLFRHNSKGVIRIFEHINKFYYRLGMPFFQGPYYLPLPYRKSLLIAIGEPLFAKEGESVDSFHERYVQALRDLFEKYRPYSPDPTIQLDIQ
ncbi:hypothetical protein R1sor_019073 [Riccia sorocarpa]|uniref:Acyltransferase n=1 Tax=Riccia sorocarpa TaxID=122646 RepID=A0ABD3IFL7_9MARC